MRKSRAGLDCKPGFTGSAGRRGNYVRKNEVPPEPGVRPAEPEPDERKKITLPQIPGWTE